MVTPLRRALQAHRLRNDWLAARTGLNPNRINKLVIGYGVWSRSEAALVTQAIADATGQTYADTAAALFAGIEVRPDRVPA